MTAADGMVNAVGLQGVVVGPEAVVLVLAATGAETKVAGVEALAKREG